MKVDAYVGQRVRAAMDRLDIPQRAVAERLGITQAAVSLKLNGHRKWNIDEVFRVAAALNVDAWDLLVPTRNEVSA